MSISFKNTFYVLACLAGFILLLHVGRPVLVSFSIAFLISLILYPVCKKLEKWGFSRIMAAITTLLAVTGVIVGIFYGFSSQIISLTSEFSDFGQKLRELLSKVVVFVNNNVSILPNIKEEDIIQKGAEWFKKSGGDIVSDTFSQTASLISGLIMVAVYTFLLLIYRTGLKEVLIQASRSDYNEKISEMISEIQKIGQQYLVGMGIMIVVLGVLYSLALLLVGIDHPFFFGFLASLLAIIPYVGTTIGATIPTLYAFMTSDSYWVPLGVVFSFWAVQFLENNFLNPKIVGGNLDLNALAAILSLIIGGFLWGVAGMAVFLPLTAILRVFCSYFDQLKPVSLFLGEELFESKKEDKLEQMKNKISKIFKR